jgi:hypothetical protein
VIGSGATAVTLVPALRRTRAAPRDDASAVAELCHVASGRRSRCKSASSQFFRPEPAYAITRWKNVLLTMFFYTLRAQVPG